MKLYIVILNWNNADDTISCLDSIMKLSYIEHSIIICDNNSSDNSFSLIKNWVKKNTPHYVIHNDFSTDSEPTNREKAIYLVQTGNNLGYAGGNNIGLRIALRDEECQYLWVLNNDTIVDSESCSYLISYMNKHEQIGVCGSTMVYYNSTILQGVGGMHNKWLCTTKHLYSHIEKDEPLNTKLIEKKIDYIIGASMFLRRSALDNVGLMYENYFLYYEELDWCKRFQKLGYKLGVCLNSIVYHKEGASTGGGKSNIADFYSIRNRLIFTKRNNLLMLPTVYLSLFGVLFNRLKRKNYTKAINVIKIMCLKFNYSHKS